MSKQAIRPTVEEELIDLYRTHPMATEWTAAELAEHLGRNIRSVRESAAFRIQKADSQGLAITLADRYILEVLASMTSGGTPVTGREVTREAARSKGLVRKRLAALARMGYVRVRVGGPGGYIPTPEGIRVIRKRTRQHN